MQFCSEYSSLPRCNKCNLLAEDHDLRGCQDDLIAFTKKSLTKLNGGYHVSDQAKTKLNSHSCC